MYSVFGLLLALSIFMVSDAKLLSRRTQPACEDQIVTCLEKLQEVFGDDPPDSAAEIEELANNPNELRATCKQMTDLLGCFVTAFSSQQCISQDGIAEALGHLQTASRLLNFICVRNIEVIIRNWDCLTKDYHGCDDELQDFSVATCEVDEFSNCLQTEMGGNSDCRREAIQFVDDFMDEIKTISPLCLDVPAVRNVMKTHFAKMYRRLF